MAFFLTLPTSSHIHVSEDKADKIPLNSVCFTVEL